MNILIVGRGWLGKKMFSELSSRNHIVTLCSHTNALPILDPTSKFDWVVNCAGATGTPNVDACELRRRETIQANSIFPILLSQRCDELGIKLAHFSSGCIYYGNILDVNEEPNYFGSVYSVSKGISDVYLLGRSLLFRVRMPFSSVDEPKNLLTKLTNYSRTGKLVEGGLNSITDIDEAAIVACEYIEENNFGVVNLVNNGSVTTHEISDMLGLTPEWYTDDEFSLVAKAKRSNCTIPANSGMRDVRVALKEAINKMRGNHV